MKSFIIKGKAWIYLFYLIIFFVISIYGLLQGEIEGILGFVILCLLLLFFYIVKRKTYIRFSNEKVSVNMQEKWYSLKMGEVDIEVDNIESIEIQKISNGRIWFLISGIGYWSVNYGSSYTGTEYIGMILFSFVIWILPLIFRRSGHRKYLIHQKSGKILNLKVTPIGYNSIVKAFLFQYAKEKTYKIIDNSKQDNDNENQQDININDLLKSAATCDYIDIETSNERRQNNENQLTEENIKINNSVLSNIPCKKGYMICPFCANEIKEGARKCQYCREFLDVENTKSINDKNNENFNDFNLKKQTNFWYKNIWKLIIVGFVLIILIYNIIHKIENKKARDKIDNMYDKIIELSGDVSSMDFNEYIDAGKSAVNNKYSQEFFDDLGVIFNNYNSKLDSVGVLYIEENRDLKNISLLNEIISNWRLYMSAYEEYERDVSNFISKWNNKFGDNKYSQLDKAGDKISELVKSVERFGDINIELYSYILSIQNDFYIDYDDSIVFYNGTNTVDKFNSLWDKWANESTIFEETYDNLSRFMVEYAETAQKN